MKRCVFFCAVDLEPIVILSVPDKFFPPNGRHVTLVAWSDEMKMNPESTRGMLTTRQVDIRFQKFRLNDAESWQVLISDRDFCDALLQAALPPEERDPNYPPGHAERAANIIHHVIHQ